jgi:hypothetical protein
MKRRRRLLKSLSSFERRFGRLLIDPLGVGALDRQVDLAVVLDVEELDVDLVALGEVGVDVLDVVDRDLGDVHQAGRDGALDVDLDERAVLLEPHDLALHDLTQQFDQLLSGPADIVGVPPGPPAAA